ncbi:hypothetical protein [Hansschlegelia sp. KR7-227]|uniref:hypothetical protein n=1 Tax=Hansschlegelia sp. KR7-227 TaxID=3400914 RepID=UPI003C0C5685
MPDPSDYALRDGSNIITASFRTALEAVSLADSPIDPAAPPFNADRTGGEDCFEAFKAAVTAGIQRASANGGMFVFKPAPGTYRFSWDHAAGYSVSGSGLTGLNQRVCFIVNDPAVKWVVFDFTGVTLLQDGEDWTDWSSVFLVRNAHAEFRNGTFDYVNYPYFQGTVEALGSNYIDVRRDPDGPAAPTFAQIFEITQYSDLMSDFDDRYPINIALDRDEYSNDPTNPNPYFRGPLTLLSLGSDLWRISGIAAGAEMTQLSTRAPVGRYVLCKGATDGPAWINAISCPSLKVSGATCYVTAESFLLAKQCGATEIVGNRIVPKPGYLATCMRGVFDIGDQSGSIQIVNNDLYGAGDDPIGLYPQSIGRLHYEAANQILGFSVINYYDAPKIGVAAIIYDANNVEKCRIRVTGVGPFLPDYRRLLTISILDGSLPTDLTNHVAQVVSDIPVASVVGNRIRSVRSRAMWIGVAGRYSGNVIENTSDEAILFGLSKTNPRDYFTGGDGIVCVDNIIRGANRSSYYPAAISIVATKTGSTLPAEPTTSRIVRNVVIERNIIVDTPQMGVFLCGVQSARVARNAFMNVCSKPTGGESLVVYNFNSASRRVIGVINCTGLEFSSNTLKEIAGAELYQINSGFGGASADINVLLNDDQDGVGENLFNQSIRAKSAAEAKLIAEATGSNRAALDLMNDDSFFEIYCSEFGLFFQDRFQTPPVNLWYMLASSAGNPGALLPTEDNSRDLGSANGMLRRLFAGQHVFRSYTVAQANALTPSGSGFTVIHVSNGASGQPCLAGWSGGAWKVLATLGANISAT